MAKWQPQTSEQRHNRQINLNRTANGSWLVWLLLSTLVIAVTATGYIYYFANREKTVLTVAAGPYQSDSFTLMEEIAEVVGRNSDSLEIRVVATESSSESISELNTRKYELATIRSSTPVVSDIRMVAELFPDYFQLITKSDSGIHSYRDLIGKKIAIPPYGTEANRFFFIMMDHFDVPLTDFNWVAVDFENSAKMIFDNQVDAFFTVRSLRDRRLLRFFEDAQLAKVSIDFIPVDQAAAITLKRPFLLAAEIPKGAFVGNTPTPRRNVETGSVTRILVSRSDVDPDAIRELTRIMFENRLDLTIRFALATAIRKPDTDAGLSIPLHEGAAAYYDRNEPSFLQENAEPIALLITIFAMIGSALLALRGRLNAHQKNRLDSYNYQLLDIADLARNSENLEELKQLKTDLFGILETVVKALDADAVTEEGFQSFSLLWESVRETINDRAHELGANHRG